MTRKDARSVALASVTDGAWECRMAPTDCNQFARRGLLSVESLGSAYSVPDLQAFLVSLRAGDYAAVRYVGKACWVTMRLADWTALANHGGDPDAAEWDAARRNLLGSVEH